MVDEIGACCYTKLVLVVTLKKKQKNQLEIFERCCTQKCAGEHVK